MHHYIWNRLGTCTKVSADHVRSEEGLLLYGLTSPAVGWVSNTGKLSKVFLWLLERASTAPFHLPYGVKILFASYSMSWSSSLYTAWMVYERNLHCEFPRKNRTACMKIFLRFVQILSQKSPPVWLPDEGKQHLYNYAQVHDPRTQVYYIFSSLCKGKYQMSKSIL